MQYSFEAEPKVVKTKAKYKQDENDTTAAGGVGQLTEGPTTYNKLMQDKRIKFLDPIQQEEEYIKLEKERIKIENMNIQLQNFRKMKKKMTPYSIKPSPNPRIEVNLEFFLTDAKNIPAQSNTIDTQTDILDEVIVEQVYVPKKTGIDVETQVEDYELFDFEREVTPICDVISTKIIEQSLLEIEEEEEIEKMSQFKQQYYKRREDEKKKWQTVLQRELKRVKQKNTVVEQLEDVRRSKIKGYQRVVAYNIGRGYLQNLQLNVFKHIVDSGYFQNEFNNTMQSSVMDYLADTAMEEIHFIEQEENNYNDLVNINEVQTQLAEFRQENDQLFQIYQEERLKRRFNETKGTAKIVRIMLKELNTNPSNFALYIQKFLEGNYQQYMKDYQEKVSSWKSQVYNGQMTDEEFRAQKNQEFPLTLPNYFTANFQTITQLGFCLAHNMYYSTLESQQKFYLGCIAFTKDLDIIFNVNKLNSHEYQEVPFIQYKTKIRDTHLQVSDDEAIVLDFQQLPDEIHYILFYACYPNLPQLQTPPENINEIQYARYSLSDYEYNFLIDSEQMSKNLKIEEMIRPQPPSDQQQQDGGAVLDATGGEPKILQQNGYFFGYFLSKQQQLEQIKQSEVNLPLDWRFESLKVAKSLFEGAETNKFFTEDLQQYLSNTLQIKIQQKQQQQQQGTAKDSKLGSSIPSQNVQQSLTSKENDDDYEGGSKLDDTDGSILGKKQQPRGFALLELSEMEFLEEMFDRMLKVVEQEDPEFIRTYEHGFEFFANNKLITKTQHIRKINQLGDLEIRRKAPVKKEELLIQEGEGDENQNQEEGENQEEDN